MSGVRAPVATAQSYISILTVVTDREGGIAIGSVVVLDGSDSIYLGRTATGGHAFAIKRGRSTKEAGRTPVVVLRSLVRAAEHGRLGRSVPRRGPRPGQSWGRQS